MIKKYTVSTIDDGMSYYIDEDNEECGCNEKTFIDNLDTAERVYRLTNSCYPTELCEHTGQDDWSKADWENNFGNSEALKIK